MKWSWGIAGVVFGCGVSVVLAAWLGGPGAAVGALTIIGLTLFSWFGVGWGGDQAAETDKYRRSLIAGSTMPSPDDPLTPDPEEVARLISVLISDPWPDTAEGRRRLFATLGFTAGEMFEKELPSVTSGRLHAVSMGSPYGVWAALNGGLMSINLFFYSNLRPGISAAQLGFSALTADLVKRYGPPSATGAGQRDCFWKVDGILLEVHHDPAGDGMVQVSIGHALRNEIYEAELSEIQD